MNIFLRSPIISVFMLSCACGSKISRSIYSADQPETSSTVAEAQQNLTTTNTFPGAVPLINVLDWGAKGDGITDDTPALIAAMNYAAAHLRGEVYLPAGVFRVTKTITIPGFVSVRGAGRGVTDIKADFPNGDVFVLGSDAIMESINISDLQVVGASSRSAGAHIYVKSAQRVILQNISLKNGFEGIRVENLNNNQSVLDISNFLVETMTADGLSLGRESSQYPVNGLHVSNGILSLCGNGITFYSVSGIYLSNVEVYAANGTGILFYPRQYGVQGVYFSNVLSDSSKGDGWYWAGNGGGTQEIQINGGGAGSNGGHGFNLANASSITITNVYSVSNAAIGMFVNGEAIGITNSQIYNNGKGGNVSVGIGLGAQAKGIKLIGNSIGNGGWAAAKNVPATQNIGIYVESGADNFIIEGNDLVKNVLYGILGPSSSASKIIQNNLQRK